MSFKLNRSRNEPMSEINVTPFVDVMLVLLIIFMVIGKIELISLFLIIKKVITKN